MELGTSYSVSYNTNMYRDTTFRQLRRYPMCILRPSPHSSLAVPVFIPRAIPFEICHGMQESQSFLHAFPGLHPSGLLLSKSACYPLSRSMNRSLTPFYRLSMFTPR